MIQKMRKTAAALLSAVMLLTVQPVPAASAAEAEAAADTFRNMVRNAWEHRTETLNLRTLGMSFDEVSDNYYDMLYTDAGWFYVDSSFRYSTSRGIVTSIQIKYSYDASQIPAMIEQFNAETARITAMLQPNWSDAEKVLFFHDYLAEHCEYDLTYEYSDAYAAMIGGTAVCQGYALAMCVLCRAAGVPCYAITSDELRHMWNVVKIDGHWYQVDATFDDSTPDMLGRTAHRFLLRSDSDMMDDPTHQASDWNCFSGGEEIVCDSDAYQNAFWNGAVDTCEPLPDGTWIYAVQNPPEQVVQTTDIYALICRGSFDGVQALEKVDAMWPTLRGSYYTTCYVTTEVYGDRIYYIKDAQILSMPLNGGEKTVVYTLTAAEKQLGSIYGMKIDENGLLTYQIMATPAFADDSYQIDKTFGTVQLSPPEQVTETTTAATTTTATTTVTTVTTTTATTTRTTTPKVTTATVTTTRATTTKVTTTAATTTRATTPKVTTTTATTTRATTPKVTTTTATTTRATTTTVTTTAAVKKPVLEIEPGGKREYVCGETLDLSGITASVYAESSGWELFYYIVSAQPITGRDFDVDASAFNSAVPGEYRIVVYYAQDHAVSGSFTVTVRQPETTTVTTTTATTAAPVTTTVTTTAVTTTVTTTAKVPIITKRGDCNLDGSVDVSDCVMMLRFISGDSAMKISDTGLRNADCNDDGNVTEDDVTMILRYIARLGTL